MGFQYELAQKLAESLGLRLDAVALVRQERMLRELERGRVDVVAAVLAVTPEREGKKKQDIDKLMSEFRRKCEANLYTDGHDDLVYLAPNRWNLQKAAERFPGIIFEATREHT